MWHNHLRSSATFLATAHPYPPKPSVPLRERNTLADRLASISLAVDTALYALLRTGDTGLTGMLMLTKAARLQRREASTRKHPQHGSPATRDCATGCPLTCTWTDRGGACQIACCWGDVRHMIPLPRCCITAQAVLEQLLSRYSFPLLVAVLVQRVTGITPPTLLARLEAKAAALGDPNPWLVQQVRQLAATGIPQDVLAAVGDSLMDARSARTGACPLHTSPSPRD